MIVMLQQIMRKLFNTFMLTSLFLVGCSTQQKGDVVVIEKTKSYHSDACPRVNMANCTIMTVRDAQAMHYMPCKGCQPDRKP